MLGLTYNNKLVYDIDIGIGFIFYVKKGTTHSTRESCSDVPTPKLLRHSSFI